MSKTIKLVAVSMLLILAGCQSAPPVPEDKYFRLEATQVTATTQPILHETVYIAPLRAEGPYAERAMLFATAEQPRVLQQYHYQFWSEPPAILLQEHLRKHLESLAIAPHVTDIAVGSGAGYLLNGKILRLEKIIADGHSKAIVSLHLAMQKKKPFGLIFEQTYTSEAVILDASQNAYVLATESALSKIYMQFCSDIRNIK